MIWRHTSEVHPGKGSFGDQGCKNTEEQIPKAEQHHQKAHIRAEAQRQCGERTDGSPRQLQHFEQRVLGGAMGAFFPLKRNNYFFEAQPGHQAPSDVT